MIKKLLDLFVSWGPLGLFSIALIDSAGVPGPAGVDILLILLATQRPEDASLLAILAIAGSVIGTMILFFLARRGGHAYLEKHSLGTRGQKFRRWFRHYGLLTVFIPALLPIPLPMKLFVICSGALDVSWVSFLVTLIVSRVPRYFALAYLGAEMGDHAVEYLKDHVWHFVAAAVVMFLIMYGLIKIADWRRERATASR